MRRVIPASDEDAALLRELSPNGLAMQMPNDLRDYPPAEQEADMRENLRAYKAVLKYRETKRSTFQSNHSRRRSCALCGHQHHLGICKTCRSCP